MCLRLKTTIPSRSITPWWSSRILRGRGCTSAIRVPTQRWISSPESAGCRATMFCTPWGGMLSACPPKITPSKTISIRRSSPRRMLPISRRSSRAWAFPSTGAARLIPRTPPIISGRSGSSCSSSKRVWPTKRRCRSTGAPAASACWPTRKWSTASASGAAAR